MKIKRHLDYTGLKEFSLLFRSLQIKYMKSARLAFVHKNFRAHSCRCTEKNRWFKQIYQFYNAISRHWRRLFDIASRCVEWDHFYHGRDRNALLVPHRPK